MVMQLRKTDAADAGGSSSGFEGVERLDLLKNVHVVIRDVGKSGILPGSAPGKKAAAKKGRSQIEVASRLGREDRSAKQAGRTNAA